MKTENIDSDVSFDGYRTITSNDIRKRKQARTDGLNKLKQVVEPFVLLKSISIHQRERDPVIRHEIETHQWD